MQFLAVSQGPCCCIQYRATADACFLQASDKARASSATAAAPAGQQPQDALMALAQLRRQLRQLEPCLGIAPPPKPPPAAAEAAQRSGTATGEQSAAAAAPPPPRLTSQSSIQDALAQLQRHQRQAQQLQVCDHIAIQCTTNT